MASGKGVIILKRIGAAALILSLLFFFSPINFSPGLHRNMAWRLVWDYPPLPY